MRRELIEAAVLTGVLLGCTYCHDTAQAHEWQILNCSRNIIYTQAELIEVTREENGTVSEWYDTNNDDKIDLVAYSAATGEADPTGLTVPHKAVPLYYDVDTNYDGQPDRRFVVLSNRMEDCDAIRESLDYSDPKAPWADPDIRRGGDTGVTPMSDSERYSIQPMRWCVPGGGCDPPYPKPPCPPINPGCAQRETT